MAKKQPKAKDNKAKNVETKEKITKLWAKFGEMSAQQEILTSQLQQIAKHKQNTYDEIQELKRNEIKKAKE